MNMSQRKEQEKSFFLSLSLYSVQPVSDIETAHRCHAHYTVTEQCAHPFLKQETQMGFKLGSEQNPLFCFERTEEVFKNHTSVFGISTIHSFLSQTTSKLKGEKKSTKVTNHWT